MTSPASSRAGHTDKEPSGGIPTRLQVAQGAGRSAPEQTFCKFAEREPGAETAGLIHILRTPAQISCAYLRDILKGAMEESPFAAPPFETDAICRAFDFSESHLRRLIQWQAIIPSGGRGRGKVRRLSFGDMTHIAVVSALNRAGLNLQMAHTVAVYLPANGTVMFNPAWAFSSEELYSDLYGLTPSPISTFPAREVRILDQRLVLWKQSKDEPYALGEIVDDGKLYRLLVKAVEFDYGVSSQMHESSLLLHPEDGSKDAERPDIELLAQTAVDERVVHVDRAIVMGFRRLFNLPVAGGALV